MVFDKVVLICPDFKWLRGQISVHIIIHTICKPTSFWPFKIQTSPDFRFSLYWVLLHFACKTPVELHLWRIMVLRWQSTNRLALSTHSGGYGHTRKGSRFQNNLNWQTFHHAQERICWFCAIMVHGAHVWYPTSASVKQFAQSEDLLI